MDRDDSGRASLGATLGRLRGAVTYYAGHLSRRDARAWVFGSQKGFRDNPRYLAEHVVLDHPEIEAWWIARTPTEADAARSAGLRVAMRASAEAESIQRRAGVAFLSNGFLDLQAPLLGGAFIVHLHHGTPLKRILLDMEARPARSLPGRALRRLRRSAIRRRLAQVDLVAAAGELAQRRFATAFGLPRERVPVLGTPRFDVILGGDAYRRVAGDDLRGRLGLQADQHVVLWLPTWREEGDAGWLPALDATELEGALAGTRAVLVVKAHPYADADVYRQRLPRSDRLRLLPESDVDVNALLRLADSLVSDYSSAIFDYSLLERPIHFFAPDTHTYRDGRGLYEPYERLSEGRHHAAWPPLLAAVADSARGLDAEGLQLMRRVAALAGNNGEPGSSERIAQAVARAVGLGLGA